MSDHESGGSTAEEGNSTTFCPFCCIHLAFPSGSSLIQCPQCQNTLDPNASHQIRCQGCNCLLAYPPNSLYIQCPQCLNTMDPRQQTPPNGGGGGNAHHNHHQASSSAVKHEPAASSAPPTEPKKRRDPNMPKAVCNAYMVFCKSRRNELKYENPDLPFGKIGAKLGEMWRNMTTEEKKPYDDRAAVDRERYRREMLDYQSTKQAGDKRQKIKHEQEHDDEDDQPTYKPMPKARKPAVKHEPEFDDEDEEDE